MLLVISHHYYSRRSCFFLAPLVWIEIALRLGFLVLADQIHDHRPRLVELAQPVREGSFLLVAFEIGVALPHFVVLDDNPLEQRGHRRVVGQHETGDAMRVSEIGGLLRESYLDRGRAPRDEFCKVAFADAEEGFVDLFYCLCQIAAWRNIADRNWKTYFRWIGFALNDIENTDVAA